MDKTAGRAALMVACVSSFVTPFMVSSTNVALPSVATEFSASAILLSWVGTAFPLSTAIFLLPIGRLADISGRKRILRIGVVISTVAATLSAFAPSVEFLIAARVLHGFGAAMMFGTGIAILTSVFPVQERGRVLGINVAVIYSGLSLGPFLGGLLTGHLGWRSVFLVLVPLTTVILVAIPKLRGEWAEAKGQRFDFPGSVIYGLGLASLIYGLSVLPSALGSTLILSGAIGLLAFLKWQMQTASPLLDIKVFRKNTVFVYSNLAALISYSAVTAVSFLVSLYLQYIKGLSPDVAGLVLVSQPVVQAIFSPFAGRLSDRVEPRVVASLGMALNCAGLAMLSLVNETTPVAFVVFWLAVMGLGFALFSSPNMNAIISSVDKRFYGVALATLGTMRSVGQVLSMGIAMLVFALFIGQVKIVPQYYPLFLTSARTAFAIFAALCFAGVFASLARGRLRPVRAEERRS